MSTSPYLKMDMLTVGQATPETTVNTALQRIENATQRKLDVTMSGGGAVVLTADQITTNVWFNCLGATAAATLTIPLTVDGNLTAINRMFFVKNGGSFNITVTSTGGNDVVLAAGSSALMFCDGTDITTLILGGSFLVDVSGDTSPALGGDLDTNTHNLTTTGAFGVVGSTATGGSCSIRLNPSGGTITVSGSLVVAGMTNLYNVVTNASGSLTTEAPVYDIAPFFGGKPSASGALMGYTLIGRNISLVSGAVGWQARARTPATDGTKVVDIQKNTVSIGSITFTSGSNTGTYTFNSTTTFSAGDRLEFFGPATQDSTLSDLAFFIKGVRTLP